MHRLGASGNANRCKQGGGWRTKFLLFVLRVRQTSAGIGKQHTHPHTHPLTHDSDEPSIALTSAKRAAPCSITSVLSHLFGLQMLGERADPSTRSRQEHARTWKLWTTTGLKLLQTAAVARWILWPGSCSSRVVCVGRASCRCGGGLSEFRVSFRLFDCPPLFFRQILYGTFLDRSQWD